MFATSKSNIWFQGEIVSTEFLSRITKHKQSIQRTSLSNEIFDFSRGCFKHYIGIFVIDNQLIFVLPRQLSNFKESTLSDQSLILLLIQVLKKLSDTYPAEKINFGDKGRWCISLSNNI